MTAPLVELDGVVRRYGQVHAVDGVSLALEPGRTVGLVGESGCGKSTVARLVLGLERPQMGELRFRGGRYPRSFRGLRAVRRSVAMVFQDVYDSLDPRFTVRAILEEPLRAHGRRTVTDAHLGGLLERVGLAGLPLHVYPSELSGGQRQRLGVARALALEPEFIVLDEPTSALDVSVQAQVLNLLLDLQAERGLGFLFISHDLDVVRRMSDDVVVMYAGSVMERGPASEVAARPLHPYTQALISAIPGASPAERRLADRVQLQDGIVGAAKSGCPFSTRCPLADERCRTERPLLAGDAHQVACHYPGAAAASP